MPWRSFMQGYERTASLLSAPGAEDYIVLRFDRDQGKPLNIVYSI